MPYYVPSYSGERQVDLSGVKPGVTTKEEVLLQFGSAFKSDQYEKLFTSKCNLTKGHYGWMVGVPFTGAATLLSTKSITSFYEVEIEFDDNDVVKRCEEFKLPRNLSQEKRTNDNL